MANTTQRRGFGRRINAWLAEAPGEIFKDGKWRFWFIALIGFSILNAILTALVFGQAGNLQSYMGTVIVGVGALLAWLGVGALHYSDSTDARLSRGVSILDSVTLVFCAAHFSFLLWVYGHQSTLQHAEADYKVAAAAYNAEARQVQADNAKIADSLAKAADAEKEKAKIEQDTAYQLRQAAKHGARIKRESGGITANISMAPVELEKPKPPEDSSAAFLMRWDSLIRLANFGELALAITTLIFIRVRSSLTNAPRQVDELDDFPPEIDADIIEKRSPTKCADFTVTPAKKARRSARVLDQDAVQKKTRDDLANGLATLREALSDISFYHPNTSFKAYIKPDAPKAPDHVLVRAMLAREGTQETIYSTKLKLSVLDDALQMPHDQFRARLTRTLNRAGFQLTEDRT